MHAASSSANFHEVVVPTGNANPAFGVATTVTTPSDSLWLQSTVSASSGTTSTSLSGPQTSAKVGWPSSSVRHGASSMVKTHVALAPSVNFDPGLAVAVTVITPSA